MKTNQHEREVGEAFVVYPQNMVDCFHQPFLVEVRSPVMGEDSAQSMAILLLVRSSWCQKPECKACTSYKHMQIQTGF